MSLNKLTSPASFSEIIKHLPGKHNQEDHAGKGARKWTVKGSGGTLLTHMHIPSDPEVLDKISVYMKPEELEEITNNALYQDYLYQSFSGDVALKIEKDYNLDWKDAQIITEHMIDAMKNKGLYGVGHISNDYVPTKRLLKS